MKNNKAQPGFTFVELIVVLCVISLLMLFSMPLFKKIVIMSDDSTDSGSLAFLIQSLKQNSISRNTDYTLHIDTNSGQVWVTDETMDEDSLEEAEASASSYEGSAVIQNIELAAGNNSDSGIYEIRFRKEGSSDSALIHLREQDSDITLRIETFLTEIERYDRYVSYDDCT